MGQVEVLVSAMEGRGILCPTGTAEQLEVVVTTESGQGHDDHHGQEDGQEVRWRGRVGFAPQEPPGSGDAPEIVFLSNGRTSAFSIRFGSGAGQLCRSDGWTGLTCDDA